MKNSRSLWPQLLSISGLITVSALCLTSVGASANNSDGFTAARPIAHPAARRPASAATPTHNVVRGPTPMRLTTPVIPEMKFTRSSAKVRPIKQKYMGAKYWIQPTQIVGCCMAYDTIARIETADGVFVRQEQVKTYDTFNFRNLKPGTYNLYLFNKRYKTPIRIEKLKSGNWITFDPA